ncbi:hypothetical protein [Alteribacter natronophilus]|uniref:hypothetical protein n=1 Tax=Alteribacter natronophilus TaxID=2583810 RepID=UPI00110D71BE|nr:hypothetical protein [Alteribacter natronophilus]TMW73789.1 hypothetical protein FGB90_05755 [Alteribacter natronophilus]
MRNKMVIFLPLSVMIGLFVFGWLTVMQTEEVTNEQLESHTELSIEYDMPENQVHGSWNWEAMPSDGIAGDDYIEVVLLDEEGNVLPGAALDGVVELGQSDEILHTAEAVGSTDDGLLFEFPNRSEDNLTYGNRGTVTVDVDEQADIHEAEIRYAHTWVEHEGFDGDALTGDRVSFTPDIPHWIIRRTTLSAEGE